MADGSMMWAPKSAWDGIAAPGRYGAGAENNSAAGTGTANEAGCSDAASEIMPSAAAAYGAKAAHRDNSGTATAGVASAHIGVQSPKSELHRGVKNFGGAGVQITLLPERGLATLGVPRANHAAFAAAMVETFGIALPADVASVRPRWYQGRDGFELVWSGVDQWLAIHPDPLIAYTLVARFAGVAAVADQSGARAMLTVSGARARDCLAKGCGIDLHPRSFQPSDAAVTVIAHTGVMLWQVDDAPTYTLAVSRSLAGSFWTWLSASAAEYGYEVV